MKEKEERDLLFLMLVLVTVQHTAVFLSSLKMI
jgi:hypothetical protein